MEYRFGDFIFDTRSGSIIGPTGPIVLRRQTVRLLEVLLSHAPELLDRNTLLDQAWGRTALSANVLPQAISELRHALGDSAQSPRYIETLHRRGYRIVRPVEIIDESVPASVTGTVEKSSGTRSPALWLGLAASVVILPTMSLLWWKEAADRSWLHGEAVPEIRELMRTDLTTAWRRAREIRDTVRRDPILEQLWLDLTLPLDLTSDPDGALIEVRGYRELDRDWITLGHTPIAEARLPIAMLRFRVSLDGD